jgi:hypothetical protein
MDELHWYALNYRTAVTQEEIENAWKDLVTYIKGRIAGEREACAELLDEMAAEDKLSNYYQVAALRIRERGAP